MKERKPLAVGDRVRLRGYSYAGKVVEGCVGTVTELRNPDELDVEVQVTDLGKVLVYPSQCRRLVRKPKERVWTAQAIKAAFAIAYGTPNSWREMAKALGITNE